MLQVKNLSKVYKAKGGEEVKALDGVSLTFPEKGMVFLLGKSGSGKSTLLNLCGGLDKADSGEIVVGDKSSSTFSESDFDSYRNTYVGFIFQEYNLLDEFSVFDNVALALEMQGEKADSTKIADILNEVEMSAFSSRRPNTLSGGQKQRVAIARALVKNPKIIMADEPTGALDSETGEQVLETLKKLSEDKLVLVVSHDREFAENYGDRIIELKDGKVISDVTKTTRISSVKDDKAEKFISAKLPLKRAVRIGAHSIKGRPFRLIISVLLSVVAFTLFGLISNLAMFSKYEAGAKAFKASGETYLSIEKKCEYVTRRYENGILVSEMKGVNGSAAFNLDEVNELEKKYNTEAILCVNCNLSVQNIFGSVPNYGRAFYLNKIANYAYTKEGSYVRQQIYGRYPEKNNEIAITSYLFEAIKDKFYYPYVVDGKLEYRQGVKTYDDILGKSIQLGLTDYFTVTGIVDTPVPEKYKSLLQTNDYYSDLYDHWVVARDSGIYPCVFVCKDYFLNLYNDMPVYFEDVSASLYSDADTNKFYDFDYLGTADREGKKNPDIYAFNGENFTGGIEGNNAAITANKFAEIVYNHLYSENTLTERDDIKQKLFDLQIGKRIISQGNIVPSYDYVYLTYEEKLGLLADIYNYLGADTLESILSFNITKSGVRDKINIVAVILTKSQDGGLYLGKEVFEKFNFGLYDSSRYEYDYDYVSPDDAFIDGLLLYGGNAVKGAMKDGGINAENYRIGINNQSIIEVEDIAAVFDTVLEIFIYGGIVMALFSCLLLFNFISSSITAKKREIGILRAVGAKKSDIFKIFFAESLIVGAICFVLSLAATVGVCVGIGTYLTKITTVQILSFHFLSLPVLFSLDLFVCFISTLLPVAFHSRKPPVENLRSL